MEIQDQKYLQEREDPKTRRRRWQMGKQMGKRIPGEDVKSSAKHTGVVSEQ